MPNIIIDPWDNAHLPEVVDLLNVASPFDHFTVAQVAAAVFEDVDYAPGLLFSARSAGKLVGVAAGVARRARKPGDQSLPIGFVKLLAVHPDLQGQGIGTALLGALEDALSAAGAGTMRVFGDSPSYLRPGVDFRLTGLICFLQRRGYLVVGTPRANMAVDLARTDLDTTRDEARLATEGIVIRRLILSDADPFRAYLERSWSWTWTVEAIRTLQSEPVPTHVALARDEFVGFASHGTSGPGEFGPMGVKPELRRLGIGAVLLKRCLADLRDDGFATADIQWVGPFGFYARQVGAVMSQCFWQLERSLER